MPEARICVTASQIIADTPRPLAPSPSPAQGDIVEKPSPAPSMSSSRESAAAAAAPAKIAAQDTPEWVDASWRMADGY